MNKEREIEELQYIVEKLENKTNIRSDDADVATLKEVLERKISDLQSEIDSTGGKS